MVVLKLNKPNFKAMMDALRTVAYNKDVAYKDRLPYLSAYKDIEYAVKREKRKQLKKKV